MAIFRLKWPFLVRFELNLGLNNLKFGQKAISVRSDQPDRSDQKWLSGQILSCLDLNWAQIGPKMAILSCLDLNWVIFVSGNGNYNSLFSKIFEIFDYFRTVVPYFKYFWVIFVNPSFAFSSAFVLRVPQSTEPLYFFECKFEYE